MMMILRMNHSSASSVSFSFFDLLSQLGNVLFQIDGAHLPLALLRICRSVSVPRVRTVLGIKLKVIDLLVK